MNCDSTIYAHNELTIAVNPANPNHVVAASNDYELFPVPGRLGFVVRVISGYYTSFDGGSTWSNGHLPTGGFDDTGDPSVAFNQKLGLVEAALQASHTGQIGNSRPDASIIVTSSSDGGLTFGKTTTVALGTGNTYVKPIVFNDKEYVSVDNNPSSPFYGRLYMTWTKFLFDQFGNYLSSPIFFSFSDDGGRTFSDQVEISGSNSTFCTAPVSGPCNSDQFSTPAVGPDGTLYVGFENYNTPGATDQYMVVRSTDGGATFQGPFEAVSSIVDGPGTYPTFEGDTVLSNSLFRVDNSDGNLVTDPTSGPSVSSTRLYFCFFDNRDGTASSTNAHVFCTTSADGGSSWSSPTLVPGGAGTQNDQFYPWEAVSSTGTLKVVFMDRSYDPANIMYGITIATSTDHAATFSSSRIDTGLSNPNDARWFTGGGMTDGKTVFIGDYTGLAVGSNGVFHAAWTDMRVAAWPNPPPGRGHNTEDAFTAATT